MATLAIILTNGSTADANEVMSDFYPLYQDMAPVNVAAGNKTGTGRFVLDTNPTINSGTLNGSFGGNPTFTGTVTFTGPIVSGSSVPVGSIIPFYDFNALVTFNTTYWKYCDGTLIGGTGPLAAENAPDLSGLYLVGYGTQSGGDIGSALWNAAQTGNSNNQINIAHTHTMGNHTHSISSDNHNHYNNNGSVGFTHHIANTDNPYQTFYSYICHEDVSGGFGDYSLQANAVASTNEGQHDHYIDNYTHSHTGNTGVPSSNTTSSSLSATQSIQPRSVRVRYILRIA